MTRFTKEDKKAIAKLQRQVVYEYDDWTDEPIRVVGYRCKLCKRVFPLDIMQVDHIYPRALRGTDRPTNLRLLCPTCNKKKSSKVPKTGLKTTAKSKLKKAPTRTKSKRKV
jgi:5-methylcytosine-specific restriction endonuclease McrA